MQHSEQSKHKRHTTMIRNVNDEATNGYLSLRDRNIAHYSQPDPNMDSRSRGRSGVAPTAGMGMVNGVDFRRGGPQNHSQRYRHIFSSHFENRDLQDIKERRPMSNLLF